ncbi:MAG: AarF/ABC1/UbiB kinase family protein [Anaerolineae bacterium]|nr:AarF/ABC1/UbiB kinase family protein [Gemmatimonadaceae bacterium]
MRAFSVFWRLLPFVLAFLRDRRRWVILGRSRTVAVAAQTRRAESLVATLAALGPTYIKLAQVFASRPDIIPEPYLGALGQLTDRVPPLPEDVIRDVIASEYGKPVAEVFQRFDSAPLAAASLGQVHRALLDGREVAVKVLRPGVEELVSVDLDAAFRILFFLNVVFPNHHTRAITTIVNEFAKRIDEEMDFRSEARNAELIRINFAADTRVRIPEVIGDMTRRRVLVLEYVEGTKIDRLHERMQSGEVSLPAMLETIVEVYVKMMLVDGVFHADPHPGNLLLSPDGRLILLDFGMVIQVDKETRARLITTVMAVARRDVDGVVAAMYELGLLDPEVDRGTIRDAARALMAIAFTSDTKPRQIQRVVNEVMSTFYQWPVTLPSELVYFGRAAALIEGIGARYDPLFNSAQFVSPIIARKKGELLTAMLGDDPRHMVRDWVTELAGVARELRDVLKRAGRDEIRIRVHPRDVIEMQQFIGRQTRRLLLCIFAAMVAIVGTLLYLANGNALVLIASLLASAFTYLVVFLIPARLLSNPFRRVRLRR